MLGLGPTEILILLLIGGLFILPFWMIISKTGHNGALSLLFLIPIVGIILILFLAFSKWPIEKKLDELRAK